MTNDLAYEVKQILKDAIENKDWETVAEAIDLINEELDVDDE